MSIRGKTILITGGVRRIGRSLALAAASKGANLILHFNHSSEIAEKTKAEVETFGVKVRLLQADFSDPSQASQLVSAAFKTNQVLALINNASIFEPLDFNSTTLEDWERHMAINLTTPFLLCQAFACHLKPGQVGRIINILDWRVFRPGSNHLPYTISKAGLAALTKSLAVSLAPHVSVNGLALGAVLPPSDGGETSKILNQVPLKRWARLEEVSSAVTFLLEGPDYITGEIIHIDGGRHLI